MEREQKSPASKERKQAKERKAAVRGGLSIPRYFTTPGVDPADEMAWEYRTAGITGEDGKVVFEQKGIEVPKTWSMLATNVVASKYFRGTPGTPERETSVRKLVARVVDTLTRWGQEGGYFTTETDRQTFHAEPHSPPPSPEGGLQLPGLVQRGGGGASAVLGLLHQLGRGLDGEHPRAGQDGRDALQVRQRYREQPLPHPLQQGQFTVFGQHVHIGCANAEDAIYLNHALIRYVPHFIALAASSPFYQGVDTAFDSSRLSIVNAFPLSGTMPLVRVLGGVQPLLRPDVRPRHRRQHEGLLLGHPAEARVRHRRDPRLRHAAHRRPRRANRRVRAGTGPLAVGSAADRRDAGPVPDAQPQPVPGVPPWLCGHADRRAHGQDANHRRRPARNAATSWRRTRRCWARRTRLRHCWRPSSKATTPRGCATSSPKHETLPDVVRRQSELWAASRPRTRARLRC